MLKQVVISDLHAGQPASLLTSLDPQTFEPDPTLMTIATQGFALAMKKLMANLESAQLPELVLLGDVMDFSLSKPRDSAMILKAFLDHMDANALFGKFTLVPGNHDHLLWTSERHHRPMTNGVSPTSQAFWDHTSPAFANRQDALSSYILGPLVDSQVATFYPNYAHAGPVPKDKKGRRGIVMHHGHFIENAYRLMSQINAALADRPLPPWSAETLETENGNWIDFAWSTLGDDGPLGNEMSIAERLMATGGGAHAFQLHLAKLLAAWIQDTLPIPVSQTTDAMMTALSDAIVDSVAGNYSQLERMDYAQVLSAASIKGLKTYISEVVGGQIAAEFENEVPPENLTFIFGHTHKPFTDQLVVANFDEPVGVYNTGGWVVDTSHFHTVEGAAMVFIDDALNTASLQIYAVDPERDEDMPKISSADPGPDDKNPMVLALRKAVAASKQEWDKFRKLARVDINIKQDMYLALGQQAEQDFLIKGRQL